MSAMPYALAPSARTVVEMLGRSRLGDVVFVVWTIVECYRPIKLHSTQGLVLPVEMHCDQLSRFQAVRPVFTRCACAFRSLGGV